MRQPTYLLEPGGSGQAYPARGRLCKGEASTNQPRSRQEGWTLALGILLRLDVCVCIPKRTYCSITDPFIHIFHRASVTQLSEKYWCRPLVFLCSKNRLFTYIYNSDDPQEGISDAHARQMLVVTYYWHGMAKSIKHIKSTFANELSDMLESLPAPSNPFETIQISWIIVGPRHIISMAWTCLYSIPMIVNTL